MWLLYARAPAPDAGYWPGRRWLAAIDAVAWPAVAGLVVEQVPVRGVVATVLLALLVALALRRLVVALVANHRYRFTTWRWFFVVAFATALGFVLKVGLPA